MHPISKAERKFLFVKIEIARTSIFARIHYINLKKT